MSEELYAIVVDVHDPILKCFIAFPFDDLESPSDYPVTRLIDEAVHDADLDPLWIQRDPAGQNVAESITSGIRGASMVIAVCTPELSKKSNPNVMYELGLADALGKPTLMMTTDANTLPFDVRGKKAFAYKEEDLDQKPSRDALKARLTNAIVQLKNRVPPEHRLVLKLDDVWVLQAKHRIVLTEFFWLYVRSVFELADTLRNQGHALTVKTHLLRDAAKVMRFPPGTGPHATPANFFDVWEDYRTGHISGLKPHFDATALARVAASLKSLTANTAGAEDIIDRLAKDYERLCHDIESYDRAFETANTFVQAVKDGGANENTLFAPINQLKQELDKLTASANHLMKNLSRTINDWFYTKNKPVRQAAVG